MSDPATIALAALAGYLVGSVSFARVIGRVVAPARPLGSDTLSFGADGTVVEVQGVSATSVSVRAGRRWGFLVALLDIGKAAAVTLVVRLLDPTGDAYLVAAAFAVVGHVWPVWHGFHGGFGVSPIIGGLLVVDPLAIPVTIAVGLLLGVLVADRLRHLRRLDPAARALVPRRPRRSRCRAVRSRHHGDLLVGDARRGTRPPAPPQDRPPGLAGSVRGHPVRLHGGSARRLTWSPGREATRSPRLRGPRGRRRYRGAARPAPCATRLRPRRCRGR